MMHAGFNLRYIVAVFFLATAGLVLVLGYRTYRRAGTLELPPVQANATGPADAPLKELEVLMRQGGKEPRYQAIADRNLFSPERKAWQEPVKEEVPISAAPVARGDIVLYGTYLSGERRYAIVSFSLTANKSKRYILSEGEAPTDDEGKPLAYQIQSIGTDSIELKDRSGATFSIGLYANKKSSPVQTVNAAPPPPPPPPSAPPASSTAQAAPPPAQPQTNDAAATASGLPANYKTLPENEKERLVKEGKLRKINTPMGAVYRPATPQ